MSPPLGDGKPASPAERTRRVNDAEYDARIVRKERDILEHAARTVVEQASRITCLGARQLFDHALAGPLPLLQEDQEIGHLLPVRPLVELPDDVGADLAGGSQDPKEIPTRRWSERISEASRILPNHRGASVAAGPAAKRAARPAPRPPRGRVGGSSCNTLW
jgi:hypothetical protein